MSDYKIPELPSDAELGITKKDREEYGDQDAGEGELSKGELLALLGDSPGGAKGAKAAGSKSKDKKKTKKKEGSEAKSSTPVDEPPKKRGRGPLTAALLVALVALSSARFGLPRPAPANAPDTAFSSARAMAMLVEVARMPHPTGSPEHARVRTYLLGRLQSLGLEPEVQTATSIIQRGNAARAATVRNVVARLPGTNSTGAVLITAHYDSRELAPGAGDDGSGVVAILEAIRALQAGGSVRNDVIVLFTDGEELGLLGARAFVDEHPWLDDVSLVLSFEMRGAGGPSIMFETNEQNGWVVRALADFDPRPFANSLAYEVYERLPNDTDFTPFKEAGTQGLNFAAIGRAHVYHQSTDTPERLSEATLQHHGLRALAALRWFGNADLSTVDAPNLVYFRLPFVGLITYDPSWVIVITGGLVAAFLLLVLLALRGGSRPSGMLAGVGVTILGGAFAYGAGLGLHRWTVGLHPEAGSLSGSLYHDEGWYVLGLAGAVFAIVTGVNGLARRWLRPGELGVGALIVPLGLSAWLGFAAPLGAMNLQWPVAGALLASLVVAAARSRAYGVVGWIVSIVCTVPVLVLLSPVVELLWVTLSLAQAPILGALMAVVLYLCLPALEFTRQPNGWWAPLAGTLVAAGAMGVGTLTSRPSAERPAPSTLIYAYEQGDTAAFWATVRGGDATRDSVALAWAAAPAGAPYAGTRDLGDFGISEGEMSVARAPVYEATPPTVVLLRDTADLSVRRVTLGVRSGLGAELLRFQMPDLPGVRLAAINGHALVTPDSLQWVEHWGEPDSLVVLDFAFPPGAPFQLHVVEHLLRPAELVGPSVFRRPPELAPDVSTGSDRAVLRYDVAALLTPPPLLEGLGSVVPAAARGP
ncbi:MAG: M20/M25/M40 family metallo-hydrolase [Gemmatimonadetes bacterium]|nr:M20/M25/M40 family metallo-hydrolase [Gemmatimonadota bacterium]